jgi:basic membrane lipoprotein Med (substrate-binding protein (PBP1-ABC) superfamily)
MSPRACRLLPLAFLLCCEPEGTLSPLVVSVLYPVEGSGQTGLAAGIRQGVLEAGIGSDLRLDEHFPADDVDARDMLEAALEPRQGRRLLIAGGELYREPIAQRSCALNGTKLLYMDGELEPCGGLRSVEFQAVAPAFLAGVLALSAESIAPRRVAGVISAPPSAQDAAVIEGFAQGAGYVGGRVETLQLESFDPDGLSDPDATREQVRALTSAVDVLLVVGDANSELVLDAVREQNSAHPERLLRLIGVDDDLALLDVELTLGSIMRRFNVEVRSSILSLQADTFAAGRVLRGYPDGQTELIVNPAYESTPLAAPPFVRCPDCETLADAIQQAEAAALSAAAQP